MVPAAAVKTEQRSQRHQPAARCETESQSGLEQKREGGVTFAIDLKNGTVNIPKGNSLASLVQQRNQQVVSIAACIGKSRR